MDEIVLVITVRTERGNLSEDAGAADISSFFYGVDDGQFPAEYTVCEAK